MLIKSNGTERIDVLRYITKRIVAKLLSRTAWRAVLDKLPFGIIEIPLYASFGASDRNKVSYCIICIGCRIPVTVCRLNDLTCSIVAERGCVTIWIGLRHSPASFVINISAGVT